MIIAVDFDGTIVEDRFPQIGKPMRFAFESLKTLQNHGHELVLWTVREGHRLDEAVAFCEKNGITFYAVNKSYPEEEKYGRGVSRKIQADLFIDDRIPGGFPGWGVTVQQILGEPSNPDFQKKMRPKGVRRWLRF